MYFTVQHFCLVVFHGVSLEMFQILLVPVFYFFGACVCSAFHVQAHHCHSPGLIVVLENEVNTFFSSPLLPVVQLLFLSALSSPLWPLSLVFLFYFFFLPCFRSFHQSQSLDQVALTNATILDGSGGGPNGSLAGSMGSVAVCLPSESSLTDSLHTSAVSLQRIDVGSTCRILIWTSSLRQKYVILDPFPWQIGARLQSLLFITVAQMII